MFIYFLFILCCSKANLLAAENSNYNVEIIHDCSNVDQTLGTGNVHISNKHITSISRTYALDPEHSRKQKISACIYTKRSSFQLPVSNKGPKFVRFHFWPFKYAGFSLSKALFSISVDQYTLLTTTDSSYSGYNPKAGFIIREFCINAGEWINVTFTPSSMTSGTYAFVNKIEIVSMPPRLYIQEDSRFRVIGNTSHYIMRNFTALEMMYRLNVGGPLITKSEDTGMYRSWTGELDNKYRAISAVDEVIRGWMVPEYTAPIKVYVSAVEVTEYAWSFPVDCGFYYLIRLHFCEISAAVQQEGEREFHIFINDRIAEDRADVVRWTGGAGVPTYKDYIVNLSGRVEDLKNLSISIGISNNSSMESKGAILNGLEIFKVSDASKILAGFYPFGIPNQAQSDFGIYKGTPDIISRIVSYFLVSLLGICYLMLFIPQFNKSRGKKIISSKHCRVFSIAEIKSATNNFADKSLIGTGGFGNVYRGSIDFGTTNVAVKRADPSSRQGLKEFQTEISILSELRHNHLVSLIGYCMQGKEMILVYEYMVRGTLRDHLYKTLKPPMPWKLRLQICIGAARGLHYLHTGKKLTIIHRDIKSTNILLDDKWMAKVSDFGLSKFGWSPMAQSATHVSTIVKGSFGYLDPEYYRRQKLTEKSDVYSFGVVLFEVLCGRPAVLAVGDFEEDDFERVSLAEWAIHCYQIGTIDQIIDPSLKGAIDPECFRTFTDTARKCLASKGSERPSMGEVLCNLELAMRQQVAVDSEDDIVAPDDLGDQQVNFFGNSDLTLGVEFSEIMDPVDC